MRVCTRCVMDETDPEIQFDENGVCNHCRRHEYLDNLYKTNNKLQSTIEQIKKDGNGKEYDCLIGLSGGVDSCYVLHNAIEWGLRPLVFTFDNGWGTEESEHNIEKMVNKLGVKHDVVTIDEDNYHKAQVALMKAGTPDVELITDHILSDLLYETAIKYNIKWILTGSNYQSESHLAWSYDWSDWLYIKSMLKKNGFDGDCDKLPHYGKLKIRRMKKKAMIFSPLQYMDYNKEEVKKMLIEKYGWQDYGGKHHESEWTKFFQEFYLPFKFGYEKKKCHLSALICSGVITREEALKELNKGEITSYKYNIPEKLGLSAKEFTDILAMPVRSYKDYWSYGKFTNYYFRKRWRGLK